MFFFVVAVTVTITAVVAVVALLVAGIVTITFTATVAFVLFGFLVLQIHVKSDASSVGMPLIDFGRWLAKFCLLFACTCRMNINLASRA